MIGQQRESQGRRLKRYRLKRWNAFHTVAEDLACLL